MMRTRKTKKTKRAKKTKKTMKERKKTAKVEGKRSRDLQRVRAARERGGKRQEGQRNGKE